MIIKTLAVGPIMANCFIVGCEQTRAAAVIDPGDEADRILLALAESRLTVAQIINTHGHFDHVGANARLKKATEAPISVHALDAPMLAQLSKMAAMWGMSAENSPAPDRLVDEGDHLVAGTIDDGDSITVGTITFKVIHTPATLREGCRCSRTATCSWGTPCSPARWDARIFRAATSRRSRRASRRSCSCWTMPFAFMPAMGRTRRSARKNATTPS